MLFRSTAEDSCMALFVGHEFSREAEGGESQIRRRLRKHGTGYGELSDKNQAFTGDGAEGRKEMGMDRAGRSGRPERTSDSLVSKVS